MNLDCGENYVDDRSILARRDPVFLQDRVLATLLKLEKSYVVESPYFENGGPEGGLNKMGRVELAQWMYQVCNDAGREASVFPLSINLLDRAVKIAPLKGKQIQAVAAACMLLASKVKETLPISAESLANYTDNSYTEKNISDCEKYLLVRLRWDVMAVTALDFVDSILHRLLEVSEFEMVDETEQYRSNVLRLINTCYEDPRYSTCPPSMLAASCSATILFREIPKSSDLINHFSGLIDCDTSELETLIDEVERTLRKNQCLITTASLIVAAPKNGVVGDDDSEADDVPPPGHLHLYERIGSQILAEQPVELQHHGATDWQLVDTTPISY